MSAPLEGDCDRRTFRRELLVGRRVRMSAPLEGDCDTITLYQPRRRYRGGPNECAAGRRLRPERPSETT